MSTQNLEPIPGIILIIDDNEGNRLLLGSQLQKAGYQTLQASDGPRGIELAETEQPDLILLDVLMPGMNGFEVCARLKQGSQTGLIPVIMVTALREIEYRIKGIEAGADEFLHRPHHREELLVRVRSLIQLKRTRQHLEQERHRLQLLYGISQAINTQLNLKQMMIDILTRSQEAVGADKGLIVLLNESGVVTRKYAITAGSRAVVRDQLAPEVFTRGLVGWLIRNNKADIVPDTSRDPRWVTLPDEPDPVGSAIGVPLSRANRMVGVLVLIHRRPLYFQPEHLSLLETVGGQLTAAIENAYLFGEIDDQRQKLEALLEQSSDAIITTDEAGNISLVNHAAESLFDLSAATIAGKALGEVRELMPVAPFFQDGPYRRTGEVALDGGRILHASVSPIPKVGYVAVMQDITELKRAEQERLERERQEKVKVKETFSRYMGPSLAEHVLATEPTLLARRERREAVVLFADLRGFTNMVVNIEADLAIRILNQHFTRMTETVYGFNGAVFDLTGDELMVGFNVPFDQPDAAVRAILTALRMHSVFDQMRQNWYEETGAELGMGIGIDIGQVVMGNVGAETRMNFAMVGETVNMAHRLVNLANDGQIVLSDAMHGVLAETQPQLMKRLVMRSVGPVSLKGKAQPQRLHVAQCPRKPLRKAEG
jgi:PAS domain S-box-containing protein